MQGEVQDYYDHNALRYRERTARDSDRAALTEFARLLKPGARVLDAGCGFGRDLATLSALGLAAEGLDRSPSMLELAREQAPGARVWLADLRLLSLEKESLDGVWCNGVLSHLDATGCRRALASFFHAIRSQGILFVSLQTADRETRLEDRRDDPAGPARELFRYPAPEVASLIRQSGFTLLAQGQDLSRPDRVGFLARRL
jgi:SAM-dependent methyltransferase